MGEQESYMKETSGGEGRIRVTHASPFTVKTRGKSHVRCDAFQRCEREKREMLVNRNKNGSNLLIPFRHLRRE